MANRIDFPALLAYIAANYIKAVENFISPAKHNSALTDLLDTVLTRSAVVADTAALNALTYAVDFGENDIRIVTADSDGTKGVYGYVYNEGTSALAWVKIGTIISNIRRPNVATITARDALVLGTDFEIGDTVPVLDNGDGQKVLYQYGWDENAADNQWNEIGLMSNIEVG